MPVLHPTTARLSTLRHRWLIALGPIFKTTGALPVLVVTPEGLRQGRLFFLRRGPLCLTSVASDLAGEAQHHRASARWPDQGVDLEVARDVRPRSRSSVQGRPRTRLPSALLTLPGGAA